VENFRSSSGFGGTLTEMKIISYKTGAERGSIIFDGEKVVFRPEGLRKSYDKRFCGKYYTPEDGEKYMKAVALSIMNSSYTSVLFEPSDYWAPDIIHGEDPFFDDVVDIVAMWREELNAFAKTEEIKEGETITPAEHIPINPPVRRYRHITAGVFELPTSETQARVKRDSREESALEQKPVGRREGRIEPLDTHPQMGDPFEDAPWLEESCFMCYNPDMISPETKALIEDLEGAEEQEKDDGSQ
jgi:hypothetical protein